MLTSLPRERFTAYALPDPRDRAIARAEQWSRARYAVLMHTVGRAFFGLGFLGLGCTHFIFRAFTTGRPPAWPDAMPGGTVWAYLSGAAFILVGLSILTGRQVRLTTLGAAFVIFVWALLRQLPIAADSVLTSTWTHAGKALTLIGGLCVAAATAPRADGRTVQYLGQIINAEESFITLGRVGLAVFLMITGLQHFLYTEIVARLIPVWFPGNAVMWTQFAGVCLLAGSIGLVVPWTARLAALCVGIMVFSWFWIVHLPRALMTVSDGIAVFEALAVSGIAVMIAGYLYRQRMEA